MKEVKTSMPKRLALAGPIAAELEAHRKLQRQRAAKSKIRLVPDPYLFGGAPDASIPWRPHRVTLRWSRLRTRAKLPAAMKLRDLRHAMATRMLSEGVDVRTVAGRLGHADASTTLRFYAAFVPERDRAAADQLEAGFA